MSGRGNPVVGDAIRHNMDVCYRYLECDNWTDPATMEVEHIDTYRYQHHGDLPPGNKRGESLPAWWRRARVVLRNMFE